MVSIFSNIDYYLFCYIMLRYVVSCVTLNYTFSNALVIIMGIFGMVTLALRHR